MEPSTRQLLICLARRLKTDDVDRAVVMAHEPRFLNRLGLNPMADEIERFVDADLPLSQPSHSLVEQAHENG